MTSKDRIIARYKMSGYYDDEPDYDLGDAIREDLDDCVSDVEPTEEDIVKMVVEGVKKGVHDEREKSADRGSRRYQVSAHLEWMSAEVKVHGKKILVEFPPVMTMSGEHEGERDPAIFEITVERIDR